MARDDKDRTGHGEAPEVTPRAARRAVRAAQKQARAASRLDRKAAKAANRLDKAAAKAEKTRAKAERAEIVAVERMARAEALVEAVTQEKAARKVADAGAAEAAAADPGEAPAAEAPAAEAPAGEAPPAAGDPGETANVEATDAPGEAIPEDPGAALEPQRVASSPEESQDGPGRPDDVGSVPAAEAGARSSIIVAGEVPVPDRPRELVMPGPAHPGTAADPKVRDWPDEGRAESRLPIGSEPRTPSPSGLQWWREPGRRDDSR